MDREREPGVLTAVAHRVYAEALLEAARDHDRVERVREELEDSSPPSRPSDELRSLLRNPQIEPHVKRDALDAALGGADPLVRNLLLLAEKGRTLGRSMRSRALERLVALAERILELELTTAVELSDDEAAKVVGQIEQAAGTQGRSDAHATPSCSGGLSSRPARSGSTRACAAGWTSYVRN